MTERTWRDYDTHLMQKESARNGYFHAVAHCPRIKDAEQAVDRDRHYVAYHDPEPCATCHPEVQALDDPAQLVIVPSERGDAHYHVDERCLSVRQMTDPKRVPRAETDAEPCSYCVGPEGDGETTRACPECDRTLVRRLVESDGWACEASGCGVTFSEPVERPRQGGNDSPVTGLARQLLEADPDDVSAENGGRSV